MSKKKRETAAECRERIFRTRPPWLYGYEAACYAGVEYRLAYRSIDSRSLIGSRVNYRYRVTLAAVDAWIAAGCPESPTTTQAGS